MSDTLTIKLPKEIAFGDRVISEITLSEPNVGQIDDALKGNASVFVQTIRLVSAVADVPEAMVRKLPISVFQKATEFFEDFSKAE